MKLPSHTAWWRDFLVIYHDFFIILPSTLTRLQLIHHRSATSSSQSSHRGAEMAGETAKMDPFLALLLMVMNLLRTTHCGATTSIMKDNATFPYLGGMDEPELKFDSEISRMLIDYNNYVLVCACRPKEIIYVSQERSRTTRRNEMAQHSD
jgi:hypothetical protein